MHTPTGTAITTVVTRSGTPGYCRGGRRSPISKRLEPPTPTRTALRRRLASMTCSTRRRLTSGLIPSTTCSRLRSTSTTSSKHCQHSIGGVGSSCLTTIPEVATDLSIERVTLPTLCRLPITPSRSGRRQGEITNRPPSLLAIDLSESGNTDRSDGARSLPPPTGFLAKHSDGVLRSDVWQESPATRRIAARPLSITLRGFRCSRSTAENQRQSARSWSYSSSGTNPIGSPEMSSLSFLTRSISRRRYSPSPSPERS